MEKVTREISTVAVDYTPAQKQAAVDVISKIQTLLDDAESDGLISRGYFNEDQREDVTSEYKE